MTVELVDHKRDNSKAFDSRAEAQEKKQELVNSNLGYDDDDLEIQIDSDASDSRPEPDGGQAEPVKPVGKNGKPQKTSATHPDEFDLPDEKPSVDTDPLTWIPEEFQDTIDGTIAINRKGFEVLAHHYSISCETDMVECSEETVIHKATARTEDGTVYTAYGEAHNSNDDSHQLVRMSDTRAFKRAVSRATGIGMVAVEELQSEL